MTDDLAPNVLSKVDLDFVTSDSVRLAMTAYGSLSAATPKPVALMITPYTRDPNGLFWQAVESPFTESGYLLVIADVRGTGESGGEFDGPFSPREIDDGVELIEWIATQPFCDGQVALVGGSYCGGNQLLIAARRPRGLRCIVPSVAPIDFYRDFTHRGGFPSLFAWPAGALLHFRNQPQRSRRSAFEFFFLGAMITDEDGPLFWERSSEYVLADIEVPTFLVGGLHDWFGSATVRAYEGIRGPKRLLMGPWAHETVSFDDEIVAWLRYWFSGVGEDPTVERETWWVMGRDGWITDAGAPSVIATVLMGGAVRLDSTPATIAPPPSPSAEAVDFQPEMHRWPEQCRVALEVSDLGVVRGTPVVELNVVLDVWTDALLEVRLSVEHGDGSIEKVSEGRLRLSHWPLDYERTRFDEAGRPFRIIHRHRDLQPLVPGETVRVMFEMFPTCFELADGDRLMLGMAGGPVGGQPAAGGAIHIAADSVIHLPHLASDIAGPRG